MCCRDCGTVAVPPMLRFLTFDPDSWVIQLRNVSQIYLKDEQGEDTLRAPTLNYAGNQTLLWIISNVRPKTKYCFTIVAIGAADNSWLYHSRLQRFEYLQER